MNRISLVLGSGGARGLAHIGVIRCLTAHGFEIGYIAGSSIGALVGGIHATGHLDAFTEWACALRRTDVVKLLDWSFQRGSIFRGDRIIAVLQDLIGEHTIEELPVGFTAVATEINDKREIWLNSGALFPAIRASIAMPLLFAPVERDGLMLVDGGLINPVPIAPTLNESNAWTVAVDLNARAEILPAPTPSEPSDSYGKLQQKITAFVDRLVPRASGPEIENPNAIELALRSFDTMQTTIGRMKLAAYAPRMIVDIPRNLCTLFEFDRARELIEFGYQRAEQALGRLGAGEDDERAD